MTRTLTGVAAAGIAAFVALPAFAKRDITYLDKYTLTGETENCLKSTRIRDTKILDDSTIVFHLGGGDAYVNRLPHRCGGMYMQDRFSYSTGINRLCNTDAIRSGSKTCMLGKFEKIEKKPAE